MVVKNAPKVAFKSEGEAEAFEYLKKHFDAGIDKVSIGKSAPGRLSEQLRALRKLNALGY